jgi:hypothetical protein
MKSERVFERLFLQASKHLARLVGCDGTSFLRHGLVNWTVRGPEDYILFALAFGSDPFFSRSGQ